MFLLYSLILTLNILITNCDKPCDCQEIDLLKEMVKKEMVEKNVLKEIIQKEILERKLESSELHMKMSKIEAIQKPLPTSAEVPEIKLEDRFEQMETKFEDIDVKLKQLLYERSEDRNVAETVRKGLISEKKERIEFTSDIESEIEDIKVTIVDYKADTVNYVKQCFANVTASQDDFGHDIKAKIHEMERQSDMNFKSMTLDFNTLQQDLLEASTKVSMLNDMVMEIKTDNSVNRDFWIGPVIKESMTRFVNYTLVSGVHTYSEMRACAEESTDNQFLFVRIHEATGACDALTWDWGSDPQYVTGYTYLRKTKTIESYCPPFQITSRFQWLLPGTLGVGGSVDLYITIPPDTTWTAFEIMMLDTTDIGFATYDSEPEVIIVYIQIQQWASIASATFKVWIGGWSNKGFLGKTSLADGNAHKFSFVPQADVMQILLDGKEVVEYTHPTDPAAAKQIIIDPYGIPTVELHKITFVGV